MTRRLESAEEEAVERRLDGRHRRPRLRAVEHVPAILEGAARSFMVSSGETVGQPGDRRVELWMSALNASDTQPFQCTKDFPSSRAIVNMDQVA
jgi:hypothetical protein